jgi:hypothetical protein
VPLSNTALEQERREALIDALNAREVLFEERSLFSTGGFGSSIYVNVHPETPNPNAAGTRLIVAIPLAGTKASEGAFSFGIEAGLAFIEAIREQSELLSIPVLIAFLGDETAKLPKEQRRPHLGLVDLYTTLDSPETTVLLYVDIETAPEQVLIHHGAAYTITARNALEGLNTLCKSQRLPYTLAVRFNELYKLGLVDGPDVITDAAEQDINALYLETGKRPQAANGATIAPQTLADTLVSYAASLALTLENLDYHFLILDFFGNLIIISETLAVTLFALIMAVFFFALLVYTITHRKRWLMQWGSFIRRIWVPVLFVSIMTLCLEISGSFITLVSNVFAIDPRIVDYGRAGFRILMALFLFSLCSPLQQVLRIPRKAIFYGSIAMLFVTLGVFIAILFDITLIPLLLSVFLLTTLGGFIRIPFLTYLCAYTLPILCLSRLLNMFAVGGEKLAGIILSENIQTSLYFTVAMLPFMLILERAKALSERQHTFKKPSGISSVDTQRSIIIRRLIGSAGVLLAGVVVFMVYMNGLAKVPLAEAERRNLVEEAGSTSPDILTIKITTQVFLERRTVQINLSARGEPARFDLYLDSNDGSQPVLYSTPMPFEANEQRNSLALLMGEGPPNPLTLEIVVPLDFFGVLRVEALYTAWDPAIDSLPPPTTDDYLLKVSKTIPIS